MEEKKLLQQMDYLAEDADKCCFLCRTTEEPLQLCPHCGLVWFCGQEHLDAHRPEEICFPFRIKYTKEKGRYMVATRDIGPLELILTEEPAVVGPYSKNSSGCLQCLKKTEPGGHTCSTCKFPVCDEICEKGDLHQIECSFFKSRGAKKPSLMVADQQLDSGYVCITPLRMLLKRELDPPSFRKIDMLMDHVEEGSPAGTAINLQLIKLIRLIRDTCCMEEFHADEIRRMIGILKTNGMRLEPQGEKGCPGVALYPIYCLINHACFNNTNYVKFPDLHLELRSQIPIKKGEEIFTRYISSTIGNIRRCDDIQKYWFFTCRCPRCLDPTELGTFMSAMRCIQCESGFLLPEALPELTNGNGGQQHHLQPQHPDWVCRSCQALVAHATVDEVISTIERQSARVRAFRRNHAVTIVHDTKGDVATKIEKQIGDAEQSSIDELEEMLFHYQKLLHPSHYILVDIMHNLVHLYAAKQSLTRPEKERKIQLCLNVLDVLGRADPGYTKWRGTLLQELIHPLMAVSKEDHTSGAITEREFQRRLGFCGRKLKEAKLCMWGGFTPIDVYVKKTERKNKAMAERKKS